MNKSCVYWIHLPSDTDFLTQGYIGFTSKAPDRRLQSHKWNYNRFCKDGATGGCLKLYSEVKRAGGWGNVVFQVLCYGDRDYCLDLENKLRSIPYTGWNIRVGGAVDVMHDRPISDMTREKLRKVRASWTMCDASRSKLSDERRGSLNPMHGVAPWDNPATTPAHVQTWKMADTIYRKWVETEFGTRRIASMYQSLSYWSIDSMLRKFRQGWCPLTDPSWLAFRGRYET